MRQWKRTGLIVSVLVALLFCGAMSAQAAGNTPKLSYQESGGAYILTLDKGTDKIYGVQLDLELSGEVSEVSFSSDLPNAYVPPCHVETSGTKTTVSIYLTATGQTPMGTGNPLCLGTLQLGAGVAMPEQGTLTVLDRSSKANVYDVSITASSSGSSSSSGGRPQYGVTTGTYQEGSVALSTNQAKAGERVTITVTPNSGYELDALQVLDQNGNVLDLEQQENGYVFTMPEGAVRVEATFRGIEEEEQPPAVTIPFVDVAEDHWARDAIAWAYQKGYIKGTEPTAFTPEGNVTREQIWMVLARIQGQTPADMNEAREWAMSNGVSDGTNPTMDVPRQQMVTMFYRYTNLLGYPTDGDAALDQFLDHGSVADYAQEGMAWAVGNGIVFGMTEDTLYPEGTATRAQFAIILQRFCTGILND